MTSNGSCGQTGNIARKAIGTPERRSRKSVISAYAKKLTEEILFSHAHKSVGHADVLDTAQLVI